MLAMSAPPPVPALPDTERRTAYSLSAQTGPFAVNFALYGDSTDYGDWLSVWLNETLLNAGVDYTLSSPTGPIGSIPLPITDATITLTVASTGTLQIIGARRPRRVIQFAENRGVPARDLNQAITDIIAQLREAWNLIRSRVPLAPGGDFLSMLPVVSGRANKAFFFDGSGNPLMQAVAITGSIAAVTLSLTRAQIASNPISNTTNTIMVSGYAAAGDRGAGAIYTTQGATSGGLLAIQDSVGVWWNLVQNGFYSLGWFGAKGDGVTDDSSAWQAVLTAADTQVSAGLSDGFAITAGKVFIPAGDYVINTGAALSTCNLKIEGAGKAHTRFRIASGQTLLTVSGAIIQFELTGIATSGGLGIFQHTATGINVLGIVRIEDNNFFDYTRCAIGTLASDFPYWTIQKNVFYGTTASKGVVLAAASDRSVIAHNAFLVNKYHVKLGNGGNTVLVVENDFLRFTVSAGLTDLWIVPLNSAVNAGVLCYVRGNKFGNENLSTTDYRILVADEGSGTNSFDKNHSTSASSGFWQGPQVIDNKVTSIASFAHGFVYSYTPNIGFGRFVNELDGGTMPYIIQYDGGVSFAVDDREGDSNIAGWAPLVSGFDQYQGQLSNQENTTIFPADPAGCYQGRPGVMQTWPDGQDVGFSPVTIAGTGNVTTNPTSVPLVVGASTVPATDALGGGNASTVTFTSSGDQAYVNVGTVTVGRLAWAEIDIKQAASNSITQVLIAGFVLTNIAFKRVVNVPSYWTTIRIPWVPRQNSTSPAFLVQPNDFSSPTKVAVMIGRARVYHANQPVHSGVIALENEGPYTLALLTSGSSVTTTLTVTGAALGDFAVASFTPSLQGISLSANVTATNTVTLTFYNGTGGSLTIGAGTLRARIFKGQP